MKGLNKIIIICIYPGLGGTGRQEILALDGPADEEGSRRLQHRLLSLTFGRDKPLKRNRERFTVHVSRRKPGECAVAQLSNKG